MIREPTIPVFNAFNLTPADANNIPNPDLVAGGFLEIQERTGEEYDCR